MKNSGKLADSAPNLFFWAGLSGELWGNIISAATPVCCCIVGLNIKQILLACTVSWLPYRLKRPSCACQAALECALLHRVAAALAVTHASKWYSHYCQQEDSCPLSENWVEYDWEVDMRWIKLQDVPSTWVKQNLPEASKQIGWILKVFSHLVCVSH